MERWIELWKERRKDLGREEGWMEERMNKRKGAKERGGTKNGR